MQFFYTKSFLLSMATGHGQLLIYLHVHKHLILNHLKPLTFCKKVVVWAKWNVFILTIANNFIKPEPSADTVNK